MNVSGLYPKNDAKPAEKKGPEIEDLTLKTSSAQVLNDSSEEKTFAHIEDIKKQNAENRPMVSEADEQLLINYSWSNNANLQWMVIRATHGPRNEVDSSQPKTLKIFLNNNSMDFDDCENYIPILEVELTKEQMSEGNYKIKFDKSAFKNVSNIWFFIEDNQDDTELTHLNMLKVFGHFRQKLNMSELKKSG
jgi:hypothetical protein